MKLQQLEVEVEVATIPFAPNWREIVEDEVNQREAPQIMSRCSQIRHLRTSTFCEHDETKWYKQQRRSQRATFP